MRRNFVSTYQRDEGKELVIECDVDVEHEQKMLEEFARTEVGTALLTRAIIRESRKLNNYPGARQM